tara:strand:+ start:921 stop:1499 length:579 start_codon:yes stop_codon:yes gene_type:complete
MVRLTKIYTKSGDKGETSLGDGQRVPKDHQRIVAYGTVDELNSVLGLFLSSGAGDESGLIQSIQNDLFDVGADLCVPENEDTEQNRLRVTAKQVERVEEAIDRINADLPPLNSFVLPGGSTAASWCHLARTVCRRAERELVTLAGSESINPEVTRYLNRLSDLLFVLARSFNNLGDDDVLWKPGKSQGASNQ